MDHHDHICERGEALAQRPAPVCQSTRTGARRLHWGCLSWYMAVVLALGLAQLPLPHARAVTFACGAGDVDCLIATITTSNANGQPNTIRLAAGTYTLTDVDNETDGPNGLPSITSTLTLEGAGADTTILARAGSASAFRLVHVAASGHLTLARVTLTGGQAPVLPGVAGGRGGGSSMPGGR